MLSFYKVSLYLTVLLCGALTAHAQNCPPNIDFETGTFAGWTCYTGSVAAINGVNTFLLSPSGGAVPGRQTMYTAGSGGVDYYGGFPVNCPNGSGHSIRLGNSEGGGQAEGISYEFTIPAGQNEYSLIYNYAVVFQDPHHQIYEQPRMEIQITNVSDNKTIDCSSFAFTPYGSLLPGFFESPQGSDSTPVWCKNWSAVSINLDGLAGKVINLSFRTGDCTFRRHFGYAYIDVNSECSSEFTGATYCRDDTAVNVTAPYGYQNYTWFNSNFSQVLGHEQILTFDPPPPSGTVVAVEVVPYNGYGCLDTIYTRLIDTLKITANAGPDALYCTVPVLIGTNPKPGIVYSWSPATGLSDAVISHPFASPDTSTTYILTARHDGGGCLDTDTMFLKSAPIDTSIEIIGRATYCLGSGDSAVLRVKPAYSIQWFRNNVLLPGAHGSSYKVRNSGVYYALLVNKEGCSIATEKKEIFIDRPVPGLNYPVQYAALTLPAPLQARPIGDTVLWAPPRSLSAPASFTPAFLGTQDQLYTITLKTKTGCVTVDTQLVKIMKVADIYVPTAFTPNNDGRNETLKPLLAGMKELRFFRVYNRWGQLVFETSKPQAGWDGTIRGTRQQTQVVVWMAEAVGIDGKVYARKGTCVLVR